MYFYAIIFLTIGLDQLTKWLIGRALILHQSVPVFPGVLSFTRVSNAGAAFGILEHKTTLLLITPLVLFFLVILFQTEIAKCPFCFRLGLAFCLGGAAGNFIDRLRTGRVIDFLDLEFWPQDNFPVFNLADTAIFIGALLAFFCLNQLED